MYADGHASVKELNFILNNFISHPLGGITVIGSDELFKLFLKTKTKILKALNKSESTKNSTSFTKKDGIEIIKAARKKLNPKQRETVLLLLVELAYADGLTEKEQYFINVILEKFEIKKSTANMILNIVPIKFREVQSQELSKVNATKELFHSIPDIFIAIELAIIFADQNIHMKQTSTMFWNLTLLNVFKNLSSEEFRLRKREILSTFNKDFDHPVAFTDDDLTKIFSHAKKLLPQDLRETALWVATELAYSTGINEHEKSLINRFKNEMEIEKNLAEQIFKTMKIKFKTTF